MPALGNLGVRLHLPHPEGNENGFVAWKSPPQTLPGDKQLHRCHCPLPLGKKTPKHLEHRCQEEGFFSCVFPERLQSISESWDAAEDPGMQSAAGAQPACALCKQSITLNLNKDEMETDAPICIGKGLEPLSAASSRINPSTASPNPAQFLSPSLPCFQ